MERFVASLLRLPSTNTLVSAGGDPNLFVWDLATYTLVRQIDISAIKEYAVVQATRADAKQKMQSERVIKSKPAKSRQAKLERNSKARADEASAEAKAGEAEPVEMLPDKSIAEGLGDAAGPEPAEDEEGAEEPTLSVKQVVISGMALLSDQVFALKSSG